ncbi:MAG TPA: 50S ribosomal protein L7ae-like protein [Clostridiaceae bacterium]|nr:50S ribosomal protein L7ae-like protein [Clostridiaceae bacterium]
MDKMLSFLGLIRKSGKLILGYNKCEEAVKTRKVKLLVLSKGASENTKDKFRGYCEKYKVPFIEDFTPDELGYALGYEGIAVVGVSDRNMAEKLKTLYESKESEELNGGGPIVKNQSI